VAVISAGRRNKMTTMKEYYKKMMQGVQGFEEEKENHFLEKEAVVKIHNIDNGNYLDVETDAVTEKTFSAFLFGILGEIPEINENSDIKTTEIYLAPHQIKKIIKTLDEKYSDKFFAKMSDVFKELISGDF